MKKRILFVCTGNTCRSPMAGALFLKLLAEREDVNIDDFEVLTAGLFTRDGLPASSEAIEAMKKENLDLSCHESRQVCADLIKDADLILTMTESHRQNLLDKFPDKADNIYTLTGFANYSGDIADPFGMGQEVYIETAAQLKEVLSKAIDRLIDEEC